MTSSSQSLSPVDAESRPRKPRESTSTGFTALNGRTSPANNSHSVITLSDSPPRSTDVDRRSQADHDGWEPNGTNGTNGDRASGSHNARNVDSSPPTGNQPKRRRVEFEDATQSPTDIARSAAAALEQNTAERSSRDDTRSGDRYPAAQAGAQRDSNWNGQDRTADPAVRLEEALRRDSHMQNGTSAQSGEPEPANGVSNSNTPSGDYVITNAGVVQLDTKKRKRAFTNRTKTGCQTCRKRKKKCDEGKPWCNNCTRGNFTCEGYAHAKPTYAGKSAHTQKITPIAIQSREPYYDQSQHSRPMRYDSLKPPQESRLPAIDDNLPGRPPAPGSWGGSVYPNSGARSAAQDRASVESSRSMPMAMNAAPIGLAPILSYAQNPALGIATRALDGNRFDQASPRGMDTRASNIHIGTSYGGGERENMKSGRLFNPDDPQLVQDRERCRERLTRFNSVATNMAASAAPDPRLLNTLLGEVLGDQGHLHPAPTPFTVKIGNNVRVEAPFKCTYGYNVHIGNNVIIREGCKITDACDVSFGANTIVDSDVEIRGWSTPTNVHQRRSLRGWKIRIGNNVFIGAGTRIVPSELYLAEKKELEIGENAWIAPGTLVTDNVAPGVIFGRREDDGVAKRGMTSHDFGKI